MPTRDAQSPPVDAHAGDRVYVRMHDTRVVVGRVDAVWYSVSGWKARFTTGACVHTINLEQVEHVEHACPNTK